jgi:hypothetical protein
VTRPWDAIIGQELSAVCFIRDYMRFEFDPPPMIDVFSKICVVTPKGSAEQCDGDFANMVIGLIGSVVSAVDVEADEQLRIGLSNGTWILISLRPADYSAEAVVMHGFEGGTVVFN